MILNVVKYAGLVSIQSMLREHGRPLIVGPRRAQSSAFSCVGRRTSGSWNRISCCCCVVSFRSSVQRTDIEIQNSLRYIEAVVSV